LAVSLDRQAGKPIPAFPGRGPPFAKATPSVRESRLKQIPAEGERLAEAWWASDNGARNPSEVNFSIKFGRALVIIGPVTIALALLALAHQASLIPASRLINPHELVKILQSATSDKPLMIQVGSHVFYTQAHIPGSEYIGPASSESGLQALRKRVDILPRNKFIVLYCGCCPWSHCPNVKPADDTLHAMGFTDVKILYIANNFGTDWVDTGYPVAKGD
jgi:thiosulfate/3-mercaptopyruvate sulfurtransferase